MGSREAVEVVCAIVLYGDRVLATRRDQSGRYPLLWEFPGGKLEPEESAENAIRRELLEELDLSVRKLIPEIPVLYEDSDFSIKLIPFICMPDQRKGPVPHEHSEIRWIRPEEAVQLTWAPADIPLVEKLKDLIGKYENE